MIDNSLVKESLVKLADRIQNSDPGGASRLHLLGEAVMGGPNVDADTWAATDIYKFIDPDSIVEHARGQYTRSRYVDFMELARNTLVLAPIIVTWYAISRAVPAYHDLLAVNPNQVQLPFLYFWQQGFGPGFPQILTLGSVALIDAIILISIFVLTFVTYTLAQTGASSGDREAQSLRAELVHALAGASLCLHSVRQQRMTAGDNLEVVARQIEAMARQATSQLQKMVDQVLNQFTAMTKQTTTHLGEMADQIYTQFNGVAQQMSGQVEEGNKYLGTMTNFAAKLDRLSTEMHAAAQTIETTNESLCTSVNDLVEPARDLSLQQKTLTDAARESLVLLQGTTTTLSDLGRKQSHWSTELSDVLDNLHVAVEKGVQLATTVGNLYAQQGAFLQSLENEREAQRDLAKLTSDATVGVREALTSIDTAGKSLRSMAHDMKDLLDLQRSSDTTTFMQGYAIAAQMIEKSANSLNASAIAIYNASHKLTDVIYELEGHLTATK
jgi:hypothetical protein